MAFYSSKYNIWNWQLKEWSNFTYNENALKVLEFKFSQNSGTFLGAFKKPRITCCKKTIPKAEFGIAEMMVDLYRNYSASLTHNFHVLYKSKKIEDIKKRIVFSQSVFLLVKTL